MNNVDGLGFTETTHPYRTELKIHFHNYGYVQSFDEFKIVGNIVTDLCNTLFNEKLECFVELQEMDKRVEESARGLTKKTIEIAQNSIRSVYEATDEKFKNLVQRNIYSSLLYKGKQFGFCIKSF